MIKLVMQRPDGGEFELFYNSRQNVMYNAEGKSVRLRERIQAPEKPYSVRIALGKKCNFNCAYCSQKIVRGKGRGETSLSPEILVDAVDWFFQGKDYAVQFWGGEPSLYLPEMRTYHQLFMQLENKPQKFSTMTNGSNLFDEFFDWVFDNKINVGVSWDGSGQRLRGIDPLNDERVVASLKKLIAERPGDITFNPTLTCNNYNLTDYCHQLSAVLGTSNFHLGECSIARLVHDAGAPFAMSTEQMREFSEQHHLALIGDTLRQAAPDYLAVAHFINNFNKPIALNMPKCHAGDGKTISIDTNGNIIPCQNFEAGDHHSSGEAYCLGSILAQEPGVFPAPSFKRFQDRRQEQCEDCLVASICRGGCPYAVEKFTAYNCVSAYYRYLPIVGKALHWLTGGIIKEILIGTPIQTNEVHHADSVQ